MSPFSETFVRLRREAGFETAYQFFHKNGGQRVFQCSFPNYLRIEKGSHLPQPRRLPLLCQLLRLPLKSDESRKLVRAYIETWVGSKELAEWMLAPFLVPEAAGGAPDPAKKALDRVVRESARPISMRQYEAIMESEASYWSYRVLTTSKEAWTPAALAKTLELPAAAVARGVDSLVKNGIAQRTRDGRFRSPLAGEFLLFPDPGVILPKIMKRVYRYNDKMIRRRGKLVDERYCGVRADGRMMLGYLPHLRDAVRSVNAYAVSDKTDHSALYFVESKVFKLFDF